MAEATAPLEVVRDGPIARVTLTRPELLNRFDDDLHHAFPEAMQDLAAAPDIRAIVLTSTGKAFSAGGDLALMEAANVDPRLRAATIDQGRRLLRVLLDVPQVVIVGLQGPAVGLGATVALCGDLLIAAREAYLSDPHVRVGLVAGDGGCVVWPQSAGMHVAKRYLLTGDRLPAERAETLGLVTELVDGQDQVLDACLAWAGRIAKLPPLAVQGTKRALNQVVQHRSEEVTDLAFAYETLSMASDDHHEAIEAFREGRDGTYRGE